MLSLPSVFNCHSGISPLSAWQPTITHLLYYLVFHPELLSHLTFLAVTNSSSTFLPPSTASSARNSQKSTSVQTHVTSARQDRLICGSEPMALFPTQAIGLDKGSAAHCIFRFLGIKTGMINRTQGEQESDTLVSWADLGPRQVRALLCVTWTSPHDSIARLQK